MNKRKEKKINKVECPISEDAQSKKEKDSVNRTTRSRESKGFKAFILNKKLFIALCLIFGILLLLYIVFCLSSKIGKNGSQTNRISKVSHIKHKKESESSSNEKPSVKSSSVESSDANADSSDSNNPYDDKTSGHTKYAKYQPVINKALANKLAQDSAQYKNNQDPNYAYTQGVVSIIDKIDLNGVDRYTMVVNKNFVDMAPAMQSQYAEDAERMAIRVMRSDGVKPDMNEMKNSSSQSKIDPTTPYGDYEEGLDITITYQGKHFGNTDPSDLSQFQWDNNPQVSSSTGNTVDGN